MFHFFKKHGLIRNTCKTLQTRSYKVSVLGAAGGVGQPLCLFCKKTPLIEELALYDIKNVKGVAVDLSHIERKGKVTAYEGQEELGSCLDKSEIVVITAGVPRNPGMNRNDLFNTNARVVADLSVSIAKHCPDALICLITHPLNSLVPLVSEILNYFKVLNPKKIFGVTTLSTIRAITFIAQAKNIDITKLHVPVIGGHSENTIIPVISQSAPHVQFPLEERNFMVDKIRNAGSEIVEAKAGHGSSTLSMSWAAYRFINSLIEAKSGRTGVIEPAFVKSEETECEYFASPLLFGTEGIERNLGIGQMTEFEISLLKSAIPEIKRDIEAGKRFAANYLSMLNK